jgi:hypothetical protein
MREVAGARGCGGGSQMRVMVIGLAALLVFSGCAALKRTEDLPIPPPADSIQGGPEGENNNMDGL